MHGHSLPDHRTPYPCDVGTKHVGFSPTSQTLLAPSVKRRDVSGKWREGWA